MYNVFVNLRKKLRVGRLQRMRINSSRQQEGIEPVSDLLNNGVQLYEKHKNSPQSKKEALKSVSDFFGRIYSSRS
jgi:hypothetical protein